MTRRTHSERDEDGLLPRAVLRGHLEHAGNLQAEMAEQGLESRGHLLAAEMVRGERLAMRGSRRRSGRGGHGCVERERRWWERERRVAAAGRTPTPAWWECDTQHVCRDPSV